MPTPRPWKQCCAALALMALLPGCRRSNFLGTWQMVWPSEGWGCDSHPDSEAHTYCFYELPSHLMERSAARNGWTTLQGVHTVGESGSDCETQWGIANMLTIERQGARREIDGEFRWQHWGKSSDACANPVDILEDATFDVSGDVVRSNDGYVKGDSGGVSTYKGDSYLKLSIDGLGDLLCDEPLGAEPKRDMECYAGTYFSIRLEEAEKDEAEAAFK